MKRTLISTFAAASIIGLGMGTVAVADNHGGPKGPKGEKRAEMLQQFDANGDGNLDETERDAARLAKFAEIDVDGNGTLTKQEVTDHMMARLVEKVDTHFPEEDVNGDGVISVDEFGSRRKARREGFRDRREGKRAEMLEKFDADGDGELSEAERAAARDAGFGPGKHGKSRRGPPK